MRRGWYALGLDEDDDAMVTRAPDQYRIRDLEELTPNKENGYVRAQVGGKQEYIHRVGAATLAIANDEAMPAPSTGEVFAAHYPDFERHSVNARFATASTNIIERAPSNPRAEPPPALDDNWAPLKLHRTNAGPDELEAVKKIEINDHGQLRRNGEIFACSHKRGNIRVGDKFYFVHILAQEHRDDKPVPEGMVVDHIDRDPSNHSADNLRVVTHSENNLNRDPDAARRAGEALSDEIKVLVFEKVKKGESQPTREEVLERGDKFASTHAAAAQRQVDQGHLSACANGTQRKTGIKGTSTFAAAAWVPRDPFAGSNIKRIYLFSASSMAKLMARANLSNKQVAKHGANFDYTKLDEELAKWNVDFIASLRAEQKQLIKMLPKKYRRLVLIPGGGCGADFESDEDEDADNSKPEQESEQQSEPDESTEPSSKRIRLDSK
jgi:hypothetical protein